MTADDHNPRRLTVVERPAHAIGLLLDLDNEVMGAHLDDRAVLGFGLVEGLEQQQHLVVVAERRRAALGALHEAEEVQERHGVGGEGQDLLALDALAALEVPRDNVQQVVAVLHALGVVPHAGLPPPRELDVLKVRHERRLAQPRRHVVEIDVGPRREDLPVLRRLGQRDRRDLPPETHGLPPNARAVITRGAAAAAGSLNRCRLPPGRRRLRAEHDGGSRGEGRSGIMITDEEKDWGDRRRRPARSQ